MTLRSAFDTLFLGTVSDWLQASGEVFVVIRYAYAAGAKDYLFIQSAQQLQALLATLPPRSDVIVFRHRQLPIRGIADNALLEQAITAIPEGTSWFLLYLGGEKPGDSSSAGDNSHQALKTAIAEHQGRCVAIGPDPPFHEADSAEMQSGLIPLPDGSLQTGPY
jgi:hypothetical protein